MTLNCTGFAFLFVTMTCVDASPPPVAVCPPVRTWSRAFQRRVAAELKAARGSALARVAIEAIETRDIARACAAAKARR